MTKPSCNLPKGGLKKPVCNGGRSIDKISISEPDDDAGTSTALNPTEPDDGS